MQSIKQMWQERSKNFGRRIEGVLPKSWPKALNYYLNSWMYESIRRPIAKKESARILDLGCGYGRLAGKILQSFPATKVWGVDISQNYVNLFNSDLSPRGKAIVGDVRVLPFKDKYFDVVYMVTTLMYVTDKKGQRKVLSEISRVLKPEGKFVIIERNPIGHNLVNLFGLIQILRGNTKKEIQAVNFAKDYLGNLIEHSGGKVDCFAGMPFFTLLFYPLFILSKLGLEKYPLQLVRKMDRRIGKALLTFSLYISYSGKKI